MRTSWLLILTCHEISGCKYELLMSAKTRWLYNTVAMEMLVVFNILPFCSLGSFVSHLFRVFVHLNTRNKGFRGICALRVPFFALLDFEFLRNENVEFNSYYFSVSGFNSVCLDRILPLCIASLRFCNHAFHVSPFLPPLGSRQIVVSNPSLG